MKNLKKVLCLVLAFTMLLGMMTITTGAANFTDNDEIENTEAVDTMVALNIINGKGDGSYFDPTGIVTRAEMAKMICVALNGGKDPQLGSSTSSYTDTVGTWAAGYIEYCTNLGIVSGRGAGIFDPSGTVTGTEAAKMLLVAIGYDSTAEGFTGASWAIAVNVRANQKDFYDDVSIDPSAGLSRDDAAQMIYNAIQAVMVEYDYKLVTGSDGNLATVGVAQDVTSTKDTVLEKKFDMATKYGYMTGVTYVEDDDEYTYTFDADFYGTAATADTTATADLSGSLTTSKDFSALYGQQVKVLYKQNTEKTVYGMYAEDSKVLLSGIVGSLPDIDAADTSFKYSSVSYKVTSGDIKVFPFNASAAASAAFNAYEAVSGTSPYKFSLVDYNGDNKGDVVVVYPYTVAKVTYVGSSSITAGNTSYDFDDCDIYDGVAKNDYAIITDDANTATGKISITQATEVSGSISSISSATKITVDGTTYNDAAAIISKDTYKLGDTFDLIVVNGYIFNAEKSSSAVQSDDAVLAILVDGVGTGTGAGTQKVKLLFADGTKSTVTVDKVNVVAGDDLAKPAAGNLVTVDTIYTYSVDSDGNYELSLVDGDYDATKISSSAIKVSDGKVTGGVTSSTFYFADDAIIFVKASTEYKAVSGATINEWGTTVRTTDAASDSVLYANTSSGFNYAELGYLDLSASLTTVPGTGDLSYGWITADPTLVQDDDDYYYQITVWTGSAKETFNAESTATNSSIGSSLSTLAGDANVKKGPISFKNEGDGVVSDVTTLSASINAITAYVDDGDEVGFTSTVSGTTSDTTATIEDDTVIYYLDTANNAGVAGGSVTIANKSIISTYYIPNCYVVANDDAEILAMFIDTESNLGVNDDDLGTFAANVTVTAFSSSAKTVTIAGGIASATVVSALLTAFPDAAAAQLNDTDSDGNSDVGETVTLVAEDGTYFIYTIA